jgi:uncharacterized protein (UPF0332 family)
MINIKFDPFDFMVIAENLSNGNSEGHFRTSVSRAYYSVFLDTREKIEGRIGKISLQRPGDIHQVLIDRLKEMKLGAIADKLVQLRMWRRNSDYDLTRSIDQQLAKKALVLAKDLRRKVHQDLS